MISQILENNIFTDIKVAKVHSNKKNKDYFCLVAIINDEPIILSWLSNYSIKKLGIEN